MKQLVILVFPFLLATPSFAAEPKPIGYVDMQKVLDKSRMGQQAQKTLKEKFEGKQQELAKEQQSIREKQQTLARDQALMSQAELDKRSAEIEKLIQTFQTKAAEMQKQLAQEQTKLASGILKPAEQIIATAAKNNKVSAVFERHQSGLLYIDDGLDLTAEVIKQLDAKTKD
jgi:outer membrane protein